MVFKKLRVAEQIDYLDISVTEVSTPILYDRENHDQWDLLNVFLYGVGGGQITPVLHYNGQTIELSTNDLTFSKRYFTVEDALENENYKVTVSTNYDNKTFSAVLYVKTRFAKPNRIVVHADPSTITYKYKLGGSKVFEFVEPVINYIEVYYNIDSSTPQHVILNSNYNIRNTVDFYEFVGSPTKLEGGDEIDLTNGKTIYVRLNTTMSWSKNQLVYNDFTNYKIDGAVELIAQQMIPTSVSANLFMEDFVFYKGNRLEDYKDNFKLDVTFDNDQNEVETDFKDYEFANSQPILSKPESISVVIAGQTLEIDFGNFTIGEDDNTKDINFAKDSIKKVTPKPSIKATYETSDRFDFSQLEFEIEYEHSDYVSKSTFWNIANNTVLGSNGFIVNFGEKNTQSVFNGTTSLAENNIGTGTGTLVFAIGSSISYETRQVTVATTILPEIDNIESLEILDVFTNYHVGDRFLNLDDNTKVRISFRNQQDELENFTVLLNSGYSKIIIEPVQGTIFESAESNKEIRVISVFDSRVYKTYLISVTQSSSSSQVNTHRLHAVFAESLSYNGETIRPVNGLLKLVDENNVLYGYVDNIYDKNTNARVVLFKDYKPEINGAANIEITFPSYIEGDAEEIDHCHFGILFGANNAKNRLFLSGNPDIYNADWHSGEVNYTDDGGNKMRENGNFTYFSSESIMYYGETDNRVIGYEVVSNDKLLVLKNKSDKEKTVYFRNPTVVKAIDASGAEVTDISGDTLYQEEFSLTKGNNSVAGVSPNSIVNFNGDTLFIDSNKELVGLDVAGIVGDNQRYANSRSKRIDRRLSQFDLNDSILWTNNNYLFITVKGYGVFATHYKTYNEEDRQYEWFYLTSEEPTSFLEKDEVIYFGNDKGSIFRYVKGSYVDVKKVYSNYTLQIGNNGQLVTTPQVIQSLKRYEYDKKGNVVGWHWGNFRLKTLSKDEDGYIKKLFYMIASMSNDINDEPDIYIDEENGCLEVQNYEVSDFLTANSDFYLTFNQLNNRDDMVMDAEEGSEFSEDVYGVRFRLVPVEGDGLHNDRFTMKKEIDGEFVDVDVSKLYSAVLCGCVGDSEAIVSDIDEENNTFKLKYDFENGEEKYLYLDLYGEQTSVSMFKSEIREYNNVEAFYITAPFVFGSLDNLKTVWGFTVTNDTAIPSQLDIAYASNKIPLVDMRTMSYASLTKEQLGLDFENLSFNKVDFDKTVVPRTYTSNRVLPYQKFVCFAFKNFDATNAVLSAMSVTYTVPFPSYGGD